MSELKTLTVTIGDGIIDDMVCVASREHGIEENTAAVVEADVVDGEVQLTITGQKDLQSTTHRLPEELR